jgi:exodeoxyribonuclease VII large subunit
MAEAESSRALRPAWGVAALLVATQDALSARFGSVSVRGELSGFSRPASGHCYFALKDADGAAALVRCAMFRRAAVLLDFAPADGQQVECRGRLSLFEPRGELQLVVESLRRLGAGTLYEEFLRRRARLEALGLFDAARKRPMPAYPTALGIVTSLAAAALHDVLTTLRRRAPNVRVVLYPSPVQGAEAPAALVHALTLAGLRREVDAVLLVRGGGSLEDLWAFNDERVVQAVAACPLPVICGVGHETDVTLCDLVADRRAATPTAAAELAAPARDESWLALDGRRAALQRTFGRALETRQQRLDALSARMGQPARGLAGQKDRLVETARRLQRAVQMRVLRQGDALPATSARLLRALNVQLAAHALRLESARQRLVAHDPHQVLRRGYAWVEDSSGRPILSVRALAPGQDIRAVWSDGRALAEVRQVQPLAPEA